MLGDFNINLLNCVYHPASENFLNMMNSNYLLPYILQPTRVTDRSATLIDNIFANTYNFNALSGNLVTKLQYFKEWVKKDFHPPSSVAWVFVDSRVFL